MTECYMLPMGQYKIVVNILGKCYNTENNENEAIGILLHIPMASSPKK